MNDTEIGEYVGPRNRNTFWTFFFEHVFVEHLCFFVFVVGDEAKVVNY